MAPFLDSLAREDLAPATLHGYRYELPGAAVDQRLKFCRWMNQFEADGGRLIIESVTVGRAREIAAGSDLTLLAAGKAELGRLVPRDAERSVFEKPARNLAMVVVRNVRDWAEKIGFSRRRTSIWLVGCNISTRIPLRG